MDIARAGKGDATLVTWLQSMVQEAVAAAEGAEAARTALDSELEAMRTAYHLTSVQVGSQQCPVSIALHASQSCPCRRISFPIASSQSLPRVIFGHAAQNLGQQRSERPMGQCAWEYVQYLRA